MNPSIDVRHQQWIQRGIPLAAALLFFALSLDAARLETPTVDEFAHVPAGASYLEHADFTLFAKNPPLMKMLIAWPMRVFLEPVVPVPSAQDLGQGWGPWIYGTRFMEANRSSYFDLFFAARCIVILFALATGLLLHRWSRELYGPMPAAWVVAFFFMTPIVLAHGHLGTVDVGSMFSILLSTYLVRKACRKPGFGRFALAGAVFGAALLVKYTALLLAPALVVVVVVWRRQVPRRALAEIALLSLTALFVLNAGMGFSGSFKPLGEFDLVSRFGLEAQALLPTALPVPLPEDYVTGFDAVKRDTESGEFGSYLFGRWTPTGRWYYDVVALASKTPLPILLVLLGCLVYAKRTYFESPVPDAESDLDPKRVRATEELAFLAIPLLVMGSTLVGVNQIKIGIRYLLPLFPFFYLLIAGFLAGLRGRRAVWVPAISLLWLFVSVVETHPGYLSHFNVAVGGERKGHKILADSNLDWGQDLYRLPAAIASLRSDSPNRAPDDPIGLLYFGHVDPKLYGINYRLIPDKPVAGLLAISVNFLLGYPYPVVMHSGERVEIRRTHLAWLRGQAPVARIGSIWLFDTRK